MTHATRTLALLLAMLLVACNGRGWQPVDLDELIRLNNQMLYHTKQALGNLREVDNYNALASNAIDDMNVDLAKHYFRQALTPARMIIHHASKALVAQQEMCRIQPKPDCDQQIANAQKLLDNANKRYIILQDTQ